MSNDASTDVTFRCEDCNAPMEKGRVAPLSRGYKQAYHCSKCENMGSVRWQKGRGIRVRGMLDDSSMDTGNE